MSHEDRADDGSATLARTKLVFLYSSDEDEAEASGGAVAATRTAVQTVDSCVPDADTLAELAADAAAAEEAEHRADVSLPLPLFVEDLAGTHAASIPVAGSSGDADGMKVRVVAAHGLVRPQSTRHGTHDMGPARRRLTVEELAAARARGGLKRFRDDEDDDEGEVVGLADEGEEKDAAADAVVAADGTTVAALRQHGYLLSVDEADLMMEPDALETEAKEARPPTEDGALSPAAGADPTEESAGLHMDLAFNDLDNEDEEDEDEEEDEEDEALDDVLFVAIVEQLVRCCEGDDLDPAMEREAARFVAEAKPLLAALEAGTMDEKAFGLQLDGSVRRFQRIFKAVYRPRDAPIVIDGVKMDI